MSRIQKKSGRGQPGISTASLPDIVFMLLFFFMAAAVMKTSDPLVEYEKPTGESIYRFEDVSILANIRVGKEIGSNSNVAKIQLNDAIKSIDDVADFIIKQRSAIAQVAAEDVPKMVAYMDIDVNTKMALINKIKERLKGVEQYKVAFSAREP